MIRFSLPRLRLFSFRSAVPALLVLGACAEIGHIDNAGYQLPGAPGELVGISAIVVMLPRQQLGALARERGMALRAGETVSGLALWNTGSAGCLIYLATDSQGLGALEHELWHCKSGNWHD